MALPTAGGAALAALALVASGWGLCRVYDAVVEDGRRRRRRRRNGKDGEDDHCAVRAGALDLAALVERVRSPRAGAVVTFSGTTRDNFEGKTVDRLEYEAYGRMAEREMRAICAEVRLLWPDVVGVAMEHKVGQCPVLEASVIIAVSSAHREAALRAAHHAIDALKARVPVWKKESYVDAAAEPVWKQNAHLSDSFPSDHSTPKK